MAERPMTPGQVADRFGVNINTVRVWADEGKLPSFRTPGGQRRFHRADVDAFMAATSSPATEKVS